MMKQIAYPVGSVVLALILWQAAVMVFTIPEYLLPSPTAIARELVVSRDLLWEPTSITLIETLLGFGLSILVGIPMAMAIVSWGFFDRTIYPLLVASQTVPKIAIAPLFVVWFGYGTLPKVLIAFLIAFFPIVISSVVGLRSAERESLLLLKSMGASGVQEFWKVRFPSALPSIFGGLKVGITFSVIGAIVGEFVGTSGGLGNVLLISTGTLETTMVFAALTILTVIGMVLFYATEILEKVLMPWHHASDDDTQLTATS